jgi:hypothetical protein
VLFVLDVIAGLFELFAIFRFDVALGDGTGRQLGNDAIDLVIEVRGLLGRTRNDQRRPIA